MKHEDRKRPSAGGGERLERRELLKGAGAAALTAAVGAAFPAALASAESNSPSERVKGAVAPRAAAFRLADVRLLEGPFRRAQELDARYLLRLEPDRMLHN